MEYDLLTEQGFEEMYQEYFPKLYNYIFYRTLSREDTEDIVSEVFLKAARNARSFNARKAGVGTWLRSIANHSLIDYYRRKKPTAVPCEEADIAVDFEYQLEQISSEKRKMIFRELAQLKEKERVILYYKFFEGCTNRQIAAALDMNESTVGTVLSRSLKKLRTNAMQELWLE